MKFELSYVFINVVLFTGQQPELENAVLRGECVHTAVSLDLNCSQAGSGFTVLGAAKQEGGPGPCPKQLSNYWKCSSKCILESELPYPGVRKYIFYVHETPQMMDLSVAQYFHSKEFMTSISLAVLRKKIAWQERTIRQFEDVIWKTLLTAFLTASSSCLCF